MTVDGQTSIGPAEPKPDADQSDEPQAIAEGVDAQDANEFDMRHGLAGAEAKPFSEKPAASVKAAGARQSRKPADREAFTSEPARDSNRKDPNERSDMISERRNPGQPGGSGDAAWKPAR
jgi:hypothetical protein